MRLLTWSRFLMTALLWLCVILAVILILQKRKMEFRYLNVNSTAATKTGYLNPSDLGYPKNIITRKEKERLFVRIKELVNAPINAKVIINSGATESIATCINWAKRYNKYGYILGTTFDHGAVETNALNMEMRYKQVKNFHSEDNVSGVFLTHVCSKTGEILPEDLLSYRRYLKKRKNDFSSDDSVDYKPLVFLDATQSITRVKIDMELNRYNAVFFSLHKIGGPLNTGILIIDEPKNRPFIPLIAGEQNQGMRGGTLNETAVIENESIFKMSKNTIDSRVEKWNEMAKLLEENGIEYYKPKNEHLYSTFLINTHTHECPLNYVNKLAKEGIYVGTPSACANEKTYAETQQKIEGGRLEERTPGKGGDLTSFKTTPETLLRVSFHDKDEINAEAMKKIIQMFKP